jgi:23S rRNA (adenine2503-C2)-methyltransferase
MAPKGTDKFFDRLFDIKEKFYKERFQLQFSIHTTDNKIRDWLIPVKKWEFEKIAEYGETFHREGERKISLNFALANGMDIDPNVLLHHFSPSIFCIKLTPVNPTYWACKNKISPKVFFDDEKNENVEALREVGYDVILSVGDSKENQIGSNCGQHIINYLRKKENVDGGYSFPIQRI